MHRKKITGFSLTELMVVVGIIGILATIAIPRYNSFIVQSRRAEARSHLQHIATLQEAYRAEHGGYYYSGEMGSNGVGYKDGLDVEGDCTDYPDADDKGITNHLGFRPKDCDKLRYVYKLSGPNVVIASAASDANKRHIFPDCDGAADCYECGYNRGDALVLAMSSASPEVCRNISKYCPDGASCTGGVPPPPPPTCVCNCGWTFGTQQSSDPTKHVCEQTNLDRIDNNTCTRGPPGCVGGTPCPSPTTRTVPYVVDGIKPLYDPGPPPVEAPTSTNPCGCDGTPDPRPSCGTCECTSHPDECPTSAPTSITAALANKYPCDNETPDIPVTVSCTPASDPPCTTPFVRPTTRPCSYPGTKQITCPNICGAWGSWGAWSDCKTRSSGNDEKWRTRTRICPNHCPGMDIVDAHGNSVPSCQEVEIEKVTCPPPTPDTCVIGSTPSSYVGMEVSDAENECGNGFSTTPTPDIKEFICTCPTSCPPCPPNEVRSTCTPDDPCDCLSPGDEIRGCHMSSLHLGDVYNFFNAPPLSCPTVTMPATVPDFGCSGSYIHAQRYWELYRGDNSGTSLGAGCLTDLYGYLNSHGGGIGGQHPLEKLDSTEHIYFATRCCTAGGTHPITSCP